MFVHRFSCVADYPVGLLWAMVGMLQAKRLSPRATHLFSFFIPLSSESAIYHGSRALSIL